MPYDPSDATTPTSRPPLAPTPRRHGPRRDHLDPRGARFLDPSSAVRFAGQRLQTTAYQGAGLLVRPGRDGQVDPEVLDALRSAAGAEGWALAVDAVDTTLVDLARRADVLGEHASPLVVRVTLVRAEDDEQPRTAPDAWPVLQRYRAAIDPSRRGVVQLQHLLTTAGDSTERTDGHAMQGTPYVAHAPQSSPYVAHAPRSSPYVAHAPQPDPYVAHPAGSPSSAATAEYAQPGWGGRAPVRWVGPRPARLTDEQLGGRRRPVVAVLDTGTGRHPWLDDVVDRTPTCGPLRIGLTDPDTDLERRGIVTGGLTGSLDIEAGHGTFIAGLVHQRCPDARILSVRVVQPDGVIDEYDVLSALNMLWVRQALALAEDEPDDLVDVVSLSLGYYHEDPADAAFDPLMLAPLRALARLGVLVVVSAGNDATSRPIFPASFAPYPDGVVTSTPVTEVPLVAVGALNPDGTAALFSNDGPWVRAWRPGAAIVSTVPTTFDGGQQASFRVSSDGGVRSTIDPDNFTSGFATWSGTSFAAPILAGDLAQRLLEDGATHGPTQHGGAGHGGGAEARVEAGWRAVRAEVPAVEEPL
jgi:Subtilase family